MHLSPDLISHIGTFLSLDDQRKCLETAKCFTSISYGVTNNFRLLIHEANQDKLEQLDKIYAYIHKTFPRMSHFILAFTNISKLTFQNIPSVETIPRLILEIYSCDTSIQQKILEFFPNDIETRIQNYDNIVTDIEYLKNRTNLTHFGARFSDTNMWMLKDPLIAQCKKLDIYTRMGNTFEKPIDLSDIDTTKNTSLTLHFQEPKPSLMASYSKCIDAYKITRIIDWSTYSNSLSNFLYKTPFTRFIESVTSDKDFQANTRIQEIHFVYREKCNYIDIMKFANTFPKNIIYSITPSTTESLSIIEELHACGIQNVKLLYYNRYNYLPAIVYQYIASKIMKGKCILLHNLNELGNNYDDIASTTQEAFDAMEPGEKRYLLPFMKLLDMQ